MKAVRILGLGLTLTGGLLASGLAVSGVTQNGLAPNGQALNGMAINGQAINGLAMTKLAGISENANRLREIARTDDGRETLRVLATCALPADEALSVTTDGGTLVFPGSFGLAPEWNTGALSEQGQRWVSACVLAHVNALGVHVSISLRGDPPSLLPTEKEVTDYRTEEGAFYGNLFGDKPYAVSCIGDAGVASPDLKNRICATNVVGLGTTCGFVSAGQCAAVCDVRDHEYGRTFTNCRTRAGQRDGVSEVITVFLASTPSEPK